MLGRLKLKKYHKIKDGGVFACDVDDTLLLWSIPKGYKGILVKTNVNGIEDFGIPNRPAINHLKKMKARNYSVVVWSAGGSEWAEAVVKALRLEDYVDLIMPKIDSHLDDVSDPTDKIGKWYYIDIEGTVYSKDKDGNVKKRKHGTLHGGLNEQK